MTRDFVSLPRPDEELVTIDRHLYLAEDGTRVVEEGDPAGVRLWAAPGEEKPRREAERLGALASARGAGEKQLAAPANKQRRPAANKAGGGAEGASATG